jgi:hypothetical protein
MKKDKRESSFSNRELRTQSLATKYVADKVSDSGFDSSGNKRDPIPPISLLENVSQRTASVQNDIESIRQLLPDIELTTQILISSVLSPKDLGTPKLTFTSTADLGNDELVGKLLKVVENYFVNDYKINDKLPEILTEALINKGAYIEAIIPESTLDKIINTDGRITLESVRSELNADLSISPIGVLDLSTFKTTSNTTDESSLSLESMFTMEDKYKGAPPDYFNIKINDNPDSLKIPKLMQQINDQKAEQRYASHYSLESSKSEKVKEIKEKADQFKGKSHKEIADTLDVSSSSRSVSNGMISFDDPDMSTSIGHPLVLKLPMESVIPVFMPGHPSDHLGYFVILDQFGNPIDLTNVSDHYKTLQSNLSGSKTSGETAISNVLSELQSNGFGTGSSNTATQDVEQAVKVFSQIMEKKLLTSLSSGGLNGGIKLSQSNDIYAMMLSRSLANQNTQVTYIPKEMMSYIAFNYTNSGIGKSLLEDTRILGSLRIMMMFSNTMSAIRNSTARTDLNITLDPNDTDPLSTVTMVKEAFMRSRSEGYPLGEGDPGAVVRYLQQAGVDVVYSNHADLPEMSVVTSDAAVSKTGVDTDLEDNLRDLHTMGFGLSPETVDNGKNVDFATSIVANNLLLSKRVILLQQKFEGKLVHKVRTQIRYSETLISELKEVIRTSKIKGKNDDIDIIENFLKKLKVSLPKPDAATLKAKMESLEDYIVALDVGLDAIINDEFALTDAEGDVADNLNEVRSAIKSYFIRRYMKENNILPELEDLTDTDTNGKPLFNFDEIQSNHMDMVLGGIEKYIKRAKKAARKRKIRLDKLDEDLERMDTEEETDGEAISETEENQETESGEGEDTSEPEPTEPEGETEEEPLSEDGGTDNQPSDGIEDSNLAI